MIWIFKIVNLCSTGHFFISQSYFPFAFISILVIPMAWGRGEMMFAFSPRNSESCWQYKFGSHRNSGPALPFQFIPGPSCFYPEPQNSRLLTIALPLQQSFGVSFVFSFPFLGSSMSRPLKSLPFSRVVAHCLQPGQGHSSLVPKAVIETLTLTV